MDRGHELLQRYLDQLASPDELAELGRLLASRPDLTDALADASRTEALLQAHFGERCAAERVSAALDASTPLPKPELRPRRGVPWKWCAAAALLLSVGAGLGYWVVRAGVGSEAVVSGRVLVRGVLMDGGGLVRVPDGADLEVAGDRAAVLRLPDGSSAELDPDSRAVLRAPPQGRKVVELGHGRGTFRVEKGDKRFQVATPVGTVTANDATFTVELQPAEDEEEEAMSNRGAVLLVVAALVGQVEVHSAGRDYVLAPGQSRAFAKDKVPFQKPSLGGTIVAVSPDGKTLTIETPAPKKGGEAQRHTVKLAEGTKLEYFRGLAEGTKPAVGQLASVWMEEGSADTAARLRLGVKEVVLSGVVRDVAESGTSFTLESQPVKGSSAPVRTTITIAPGAKVVFKDADKGKKPAVGYFARVWLAPGSKELASGVVFSSRELDAGPGTDGPKKGVKPAPEKPPVGKPAAEKPKGGKPASDKPKPDRPAPEKPPVGKPVSKRPDEVVRPARDPLPVSRTIDIEVDRRLKEEGVAVSPLADDAEFLRRVCLDLTGRIPSYRHTTNFLDSKDPEKRKKLINELLASPTYGEHFATLWRYRLSPPPEGAAKKGRDSFAPWLAEQFNRNRGWNDIVADLLLAEGPIARTPQSAFLMANGENFDPRPNLVTASTARLFWGLQLRCAECHDHPFAPWKQADFWGVAAFFGRLRFTGFKGGTPSLTEMDAPEVGGKSARARAEVRGAGIVIPTSGGKGSGRVVQARFLGEDAPTLPESGPLRPTFVRWATGADNPFFARAGANRLWAHFFGRGLVNPVDDLDSSPPSHPELLKRLAKEFAESGFDQKHLARCICNSRAYQRSSRSVAGNERDFALFSHMTLKVLSPEMFFDSLAVLSAVDKNAPRVAASKGKLASLKDMPAPASPFDRDDFARLFRSAAEAEDVTQWTQGIPQMLRLLNGPLLNEGAPAVEQLCGAEVSREEAVATLFLTALSRRPSAAEQKAMGEYLDRRKDARDGYRGVLWILLNSSEFAINH